MNNYTIQVNTQRVIEPHYITGFDPVERAITTSESRSEGMVFYCPQAAERYFEDTLRKFYTRSFFEIVKIKFQVKVGKANMV